MPSTGWKLWRRPAFLDVVDQAKGLALLRDQARGPGTDGVLHGGLDDLHLDRRGPARPGRRDRVADDELLLAAFTEQGDRLLADADLAVEVIPGNLLVALLAGLVGVGAQILLDVLVLAVLAWVASKSRA